MPRRPRIDIIGYYHIINRGVARSNIFLNDIDKDKFLKILNETCKIYHFNIHSFCLMDNHYHFLLETTDENLSLLMRQINSKEQIGVRSSFLTDSFFWCTKTIISFDEKGAIMARPLRKMLVIIGNVRLKKIKSMVAFKIWW